MLATAERLTRRKERAENRGQAELAAAFDEYGGGGDDGGAQSAGGGQAPAASAVFRLGTTGSWERMRSPQQRVRCTSRQPSQATSWSNCRRPELQRKIVEGCATVAWFVDGLLVVW
jgi:hypothetical protein